MVAIATITTEHLKIHIIALVLCCDSVSVLACTRLTKIAARKNEMEILQRWRYFLIYFPQTNVDFPILLTFIQRTARSFPVPPFFDNLFFFFALTCDYLLFHFVHNNIYSEIRIQMAQSFGAPNLQNL